jgi:hypothetical protein
MSDMSAIPSPSLCHHPFYSSCHIIVKSKCRPLRGQEITCAPLRAEGACSTSYTTRIPPPTARSAHNSTFLLLHHHIHVGLRIQTSADADFSSLCLQTTAHISQELLPPGHSRRRDLLAPWSSAAFLLNTTRGRPSASKRRIKTITSQSPQDTQISG